MPAVAKAPAVPTFGAVAGELIASRRHSWRNAIHAKQWTVTLETYCQSIWSKPIDQVDLASVLAVLTPIWQRIPTTAQRLRSRIEAVLNAAKVKGFRSGENPAQWRANLEHLLPRRPKLEQSHHPAMHYQDMPAFMANLRKIETAPARALELLILSAVRLGELRDADWSEIDLGQRIWSIPAPRMKGGLGHRIPLSMRAVAILKQLTPASSGLVFPGLAPGRPISPIPLRKFLPAGISLHGFRSSFRDFAGDRGFPREVAEAALAHVIGSAAERSYRRGDALERRRELMEAWAQYCASKPSR